MESNHPNNPKQNQLQVPIIPGENGNKLLMLTPSIALFDHLIKEYKSILDETHPKLVNEKKRQGAILDQKTKAIENYRKYQEELLYKQLNCEIQNAYDESNDIVFSNNQHS